jgi:integrase
MLNTGMQQKDISELSWSEVDLDLGRIVRKRSKTRRFQNSPTVNYQLWECTSKLLQEFSSEGDPVLKNRSGESLYKQSLKANGKAKKSDSIKNAFFRAKQKAGIQKPLKLLRKTSATLIAEEFGEGLAALFLGHSPKSVAGRHYIRPSQKRLDEAVEWLGSKITEMVDPTS